jgi:hypothetical protein
MFEIRDAIVEISKAEDVRINIQNNSSLAINIVNSSSNDGSSEERSALARKAAKKAFEIFKKRDSLEVIFVAFSKFEQKYLVVTYSQTIQSFKFNPAEIRAMSPNQSMQSDASKPHR